MITKDPSVTRRQWLRSGLAVTGMALTSKAALATNVPSAARVQLSLNENPFGPSPLAAEAIQKQLHSLERYVGSEALSLETQIAEQEKVSPEQVILGEILDQLGLQLALAGNKGGEFIYSEPGYTELVDAVSPGGGVTVPVPLNDRLENDLPGIARKVNAKTRAIYIVNPHNPTGTVSEAGAFKRFIREMAKRTLAIVDEAYLEFEPDFEDRTTASLVRAGENVVVFRTFGKIYGMAGLSIGYAIAPHPLAAFLKARGLGVSLELNRLSLAAASASLRDRQYISRVRSLVVNERNKWNQLFQQLDIRHSDSRGNFVFLETKRPHAQFAAALSAQGIDIGRAFPPLDSWARISIGLAADNNLARAAVEKVLRS